MVVVMRRVSLRAQASLDLLAFRSPSPKALSVGGPENAVDARDIEWASNLRIMKERKQFYNSEPDLKQVLIKH